MDSNMSLITQSIDMPDPQHVSGIFVSGGGSHGRSPSKGMLSGSFGNLSLHTSAPHQHNSNVASRTSSRDSSSSNQRSRQPSVEKPGIKPKSAESQENPPLTKAQKKAKKQAERASRKAHESQKSNDTGSSNSHSFARGSSNANGPKTGADGSSSRNTKPKIQGKEFAMFRHLVPASRVTKAPEVLQKEMRIKGQILHPAMIKLGLMYQNYKIVGSNSRAIALMQAFREVIADYETPPNTAMSRHLDAHLKPQINYLVSSRPLSVSMGNCIRFLKMEIAAIPPETPEDEAKATLEERICCFVRDRIVAADSVIVELAIQKIKNGDVIMTFGNSSVVRKLLLHAHLVEKLQFRVIVVDSRPLHEGRVLLEKLVQFGINCTYVPLRALSFAMKGVSKVFLGAHALLSNGSVMARTGSAIVALMANEVGAPVITLCETYKFSDKVQLDSFVNNELGDADDLVNLDKYPSLERTTLCLDQDEDKPTEDLMGDWRRKQNLRLLNLMFDVTPSEFITMVITEIGMIPCSSVPVVIREGVKAAGGNLG